MESLDWNNPVIACGDIMDVATRVDFDDALDALALAQWDDAEDNMEWE